MDYTEWTLAGQIGVDAGLLWVGDPCYILKDDSEARAKEFGADWSEFCDIVQEKMPSDDFKQFAQFNYDLGHAGLGVLTRSGHGDGTYNVYVQYGEPYGQIARVLIELDGADDPE